MKLTGKSHFFILFLFPFFMSLQSCNKINFAHIPGFESENSAANSSGGNSSNPAPPANPNVPLPSGVLDSSFGFWTWGLPLKLDYGYAGAVLQNDNVLVAGYGLNYVSANSNNDIAVVEVLPNGNLDPSFGNNGVIYINSMPISDEKINHLLVDGSGNIFILGTIDESAEQDLAVWKLNPNGSPDLSFGNSGLARIDLPNSNSQETGLKMVIDSQNRIVVSGFAHIGSNYDFCIWRLLADGTLDLTFNTSGFHRLTDVESRPLAYEQFSSLALDGQDRIYAVGFSQNTSATSNFDLVLARFLDDGTLDPSFDGDGILIWDNGKNDYGDTILVDGDSVFVAGASSYPGASTDLLVLKFNDSGVLDSSFGSTGVFHHNGAAGGNDTDGAYQILMDSNKNLILLGYSNSTALNSPSPNTDFAIWRLKPDGTLDPEFNNLGFFTYNNQIYDYGFSGAIDKQNRILLFGFTGDWNNNLDFAALRIK